MAGDDARPLAGVIAWTRPGNRRPRAAHQTGEWPCTGIWGAHLARLASYNTPGPPNGRQAVHRHMGCALIQACILQHAWPTKRAAGRAPACGVRTYAGLHPTARAAHQTGEWPCTGMWGAHLCRLASYSTRGPPNGRMAVHRHVGCALMQACILQHARPTKRAAGRARRGNPVEHGAPAHPAH